MGQGLPVIMAFAAGFAVLGGCRGPESFSPRALEIESSVAYRDGDQIVATDKMAYQAVTVNKARSDLNDAGRLRVEVQLQSQVNYQAELETRTVFLDADNFEIKDDNTGWRMLLVPAGGTALISETSLTSKATGYTIQLRTPGASR